MVNIEEIKNSLEIEQVAALLEELGGEPKINGDIIISRTICHNSREELGNASKKLYYYDNTKLFRCYTACGSSFDIFELVKKVKELELGTEYSLFNAIRYIMRFYSISVEDSPEEDYGAMRDYLTALKNYDRIKEMDVKQQDIELKSYDKSIINNFPSPIIIPWLEEEINEEAMRKRNIKYNPTHGSVIIPHYDINNNLIGIRERTLVKQNEEKDGKYLPARIGGVMYNHPLSFALYNLNNSKNNIKRLRRAIVFEGEKSTLKYASIFGEENDISVACCGSALIKYQVHLLTQLGVQEIIVALDKQYQVYQDREYQKLLKNLTQIHNKYGQFLKISFLFDEESLLGYKDSPIDRGKDIFLELYRNKVNLY